MRTTFELNKEIRNNATRVLLAAGIPVKLAINKIKNAMPYLFVSKQQIQLVEDSFNQ